MNKPEQTHEADKADDTPCPAMAAFRRAARGVLQEAVNSNSPIPIWTGSKVVWEVPTKQLEQLNALEANSHGET